MGKEKIILTGDRPTGRLHIGHYVGSLKRRVELQNSGLYDKTFIFIASFAACGPADRGHSPSDQPERVIFTKKYLEILADKPKKMSTQKMQIVI